MKKQILCVLLTALVLFSFMPVFAATADSPSAWAESEVTSAIEIGLVPDGIQQDYGKPITRAEFAALIVRLADVWGDEGKIVPLSERQLDFSDTVFEDTDNQDVLTCAALGIVEGDGNGHFRPDDPITRQEASKMLYYAAGSLTTIISEEISTWGALTPSEMPHVFDDGRSIYAWARPTVYWVYRNGIMQGFGDNRFGVQGNYTREQSILTVLRLYELHGETQKITTKPPLDYYPLGDEKYGNIDDYLGSDLKLYKPEEVSFTYPIGSKYMIVVDSVGVGVSYSHIINSNGERMLTDFMNSNGYFYTIRLNGSISQVRLRDTDTIYNIDLDTGAVVDQFPDEPAVSTDDNVKIVGVNGFYTLYGKTGKALSKTYRNALYRIDNGLYAGWVADNQYEIVSCDGVNKARVLLTENMRYGFDVESDGGGQYLVQTGNNTCVVFDHYGVIIGQIDTDSSRGSIYSARFVNGIIRVDTGGVEIQYFLPSGKRLPLQRQSDNGRYTGWEITATN